MTPALSQPAFSKPQLQLDADSSPVQRAGHFGKEHFPCDHPECLETKFVVFASEQELRKHRMEQHRGELVDGLSRAERRAALTIPINVNVR